MSIIIFEDLPSENTPIDADTLNKFVQDEVISDAYDSTQTYDVGDYCIYNNALYKCTTKIETAEEFNSTHWAAVNVSSELKKKLNTTLNVSVAGTSCDDYEDDGVWFFNNVNTPTNKPSNTANRAGYLYVARRNNNEILQRWTVFSNDSADIFERQKTAGTWNAWKRVAGEKNWIATTLTSDYTLPSNSGVILPVNKLIESVGNKLTVNSDGEIVVGYGVNHIKVVGQAYFYQGAVNARKSVYITKNNIQIATMNNYANNQYQHFGVSSPIFAVQQGDKIRLAMIGNANDLIKAYSNGTFLSVEVVD